MRHHVGRNLYVQKNMFFTRFREPISVIICGNQTMFRVFFVVIAGIALCAGVARGTEGTERKEGDHSMKTLRPCYASPNCVSSQAKDARHRMEPFPFAGPRDEAQARLRMIIEAMPRSAITKEEPAYLAASFSSRIFGFVDETEFLFDERNGLVHFRSGARTGYYDFGVNRSRMREIAEAFKTAR